MTKKEVTNLSYKIIGCAINVHKELGPGLLTSIYDGIQRPLVKINTIMLKNRKPVLLVQLSASPRALK